MEQSRDARGVLSRWGVPHYLSHGYLLRVQHLDLLHGLAGAPHPPATGLHPYHARSERQHQWHRNCYQFPGRHPLFTTVPLVVTLAAAKARTVAVASATPNPAADPFPLPAPLPAAWACRCPASAIDRAARPSVRALGAAVPVVAAITMIPLAVAVAPAHVRRRRACSTFVGFDEHPHWARPGQSLRSCPETPPLSICPRLPPPSTGTAEAAAG